MLLVGRGTDALPVIDTVDHAGDVLAETPTDSTNAVSTTLALSEPTSLPDDVLSGELVIGRHETFYDAMRRMGAGHTDIMALVTSCKPYRDLSRVRGGMTFEVAVDEAGDVHNLRFDLSDDESYLVFDRGEDDGFRVHMLTYPVEHRTCVVAGTVDNSLYLSLQDVGAPRALASKMNDILGWDVDFRRDVRKGDTFRILYEEIYREGKFVRTGPILALNYINRGKEHWGFRYVVEDGRPGYYNEKGHNLEKQLLRAPLEYSRISSSFSARRFHPVHKRWMPHWGVDYAAPVGTPIRAAGSGTVLDARFHKSNGRFVRIEHTNRSYQTYYLHLSRFAGGVKKGTKVKQGQIIGYVGATGVATGPHLDYRVKVDGHWKNPRTLKLPPAEPLSGDDLLSFRSQLALSCYSMAAAPPECTAYTVKRDQPLCPPYAPNGPFASTPPRFASLIAIAP